MGATIRIRDRIVGEGNPCFVIAEIGINHNGKLSIAKTMVEVIASCGADCVKFQKRSVERILTREGLDMPYQHENSFGATYGEHRRALELSGDEYGVLKRHAEERGMEFLASAWDEESADLLEELGVAAYKVASADVTNLPLLEHVAAKGKPVILSTGMARMGEVERAVETIRRRNEQLALLQCTSKYPCEFGEVNLRVMLEYRRRFGCVVGYSGHERGISVTVGAVALGASIVEKHFTLDRAMKGGDHAASLEPGGLRKLTRDIRAFEEALGSPEKRVQASELPIRRKLAKSLVSAEPIGKGTALSARMLTTKGPGTGLSPARMGDVMGKRVLRDIPEDTVIMEEDVQWD